MSEVQAGPRPAIVVQSPHVDAQASPPPTHPAGALQTSTTPPNGPPGSPPTASAGSSDHINGAHSTVKWFDPRKGFGFVVGPDGQDVFVHFSAIHGEGFKALKDNSRVEYDAVLADGRWKATRVVRLDGNDDGPEIHVVPRRNNSAPRTARR